MEPEGKRRKPQPRKVKTASHNPFSVLPTEDVDETLTDMAHGATPRRTDKETGGLQTGSQDVEEEDELSNLKPLTSTPIAPTPSMIQTTMAAFVQSRPRVADQNRPSTTASAIRPAGNRRVPDQQRPPQPSQRLQHIEHALSKAPQVSESDTRDEKPRGKKRRMDEGDTEAADQTKELPPAVLSPWDPSPLRFDIEDSDDDMYTDPGEDLHRPNPSQETPEHTADYLAHNQESPVRPPPTKRPNVNPMPARERVNPFDRFQRQTAPPTSPYVSPPPGGFKLPNTSVAEIFRYCTQASLDRANSIVGRKATVWILNDGHVTTPLDFARRISLISMTVKGAIEDPTADPIVTPMEVNINKPDGSGKYQHKIIQPYTISGLTSLAFDKLRSRVYWSRKEITIGVFPDPIPIAPYVLTLTDTTFLHADKLAEDKMTAQVQNVLRNSADFVTFTENYRDRKPTYMGIPEFVEYTIRSARARALKIEQGGSPLVIFLVDITSPTDDAVEWEKVCQGLRHINWTGVHCALVKARIHDYHCGNCKALDHPTTLCPVHALGLYPNVIDEPADPPTTTSLNPPSDESRVNPFGLRHSTSALASILGLAAQVLVTKLSKLGLT